MEYELTDVIAVKALENYELELTFDDGTKGRVDIAKLVPFTGIFAALKDKDYFRTVFINKDTGTICWKNGADLSPVFLRKNITTC